MAENREALLHQKTAHGLIIDQFAGPGGWSEGLKALGYSELGIEWDEDACATARAAGHERLLADVAALTPSDFAPCWGMIGSPPCPTFSNAGKGAGRRDMEHVIACALELAAGNDTRAEHRAACEDERSMLVVEPLRWALALRPEWIALEQVPPVLELWTMFGHILEQHGYSVWVGVLEAERYGVPQTRERAILMASRVRTVHPPRPTHQRYVGGQPQRHDVTLEGEILPWVSMAEALGWGMTERPSITLTAGSNRQGGPDPLDGGSGARATLRQERERGAWALRMTTMPNSAKRPVDAASCQWVHERPSTAVCGDPRIFPPGWRGSPEDYASGDGPTRAGTNAIRVTQEEAAILQSFRSDYPWQGNKSKQFQQIGNAVPPLLARAVLAELAVDVEEARDAA
jgi:DNA (cytosine-5)-methyltransferase 1